MILLAVWLAENTTGLRLPLAVALFEMVTVLPLTAVMRLVVGSVAVRLEPTANMPAATPVVLATVVRLPLPLVVVSVVVTLPQLPDVADATVATLPLSWAA